MNDLKDSHETIKQTTDELKKQQDDLKNIIDTLNKEKNNWVDYFPILLIMFFYVHIFQAKKSDVENLDEKIQNLQNLLVSLCF